MYLLHGMALRKSLHYLDECFHATKRSNANSTFDMLARQVGDSIERLVKSRWLVVVVSAYIGDSTPLHSAGRHQFIKEILQQLNKDKTTSSCDEAFAFRFCAISVRS